MPSPRRLHWIVRGAATLALLLGGLALLGWVFDIEVLKSVAPRWTTMRVLTALSLMSCGAALLLGTGGGTVGWRRTVFLASGALVLVAGGASATAWAWPALTGHGAGWADAPGAVLLFGLDARMALPTSITFVGLGAAMLLLGWGTRRGADIGHAVLVPVSLLSYLVPVAYLMDARSVHTFMDTPVAFNTGLAFCALSVALYCIRPDTWFMKVFTAPDSGGLMARRLLPAMLILLALVGWLRVASERAGLIDEPVGAALAILANVFVLLWVLWLVARSANREEEGRRKAEADLRVGEERYRGLVETSPDAVFVNCEGRISFANPAAVLLFGAEEPSRIVGSPVFDRFPREYHPVMAERIQRVLAGERAPLIETRILRLDGQERHVEVAASPTVERGVPAVQVVLRDITDRKQVEDALRRSEARLRELNRALEQRVEERTSDLDTANHTLRMISECNQVLVRETDEVDLMKRVCEIVTTIGGYRMAWVGLAERDEARTVRPVAAMGFADGYLERTRITWADDEFGRGPTGTCIRLGETRVSQDFATDAELAPWREEALKRGYRSSIALPLVNGGQALGALTLYSELPRAFGDGQVALLSELADDLAFGITALRVQRERDHALENTERQAEQLRQLAVQLTQAEQKERQRLAKILHDHVQQLLVGARMQVELARRRTGDESQPSLLMGADSILREAIDASRSLAVELSPPALHGGGLAGGLGWLASQLKEKQHFEVVFQVAPDAEPQTEDVRFLLFECVRELLLNAVKHSGVTEASVTVAGGPGRHVEVTVVDAGCGFSPSEVQGPRGDATFGLFSIQQRLAHIGGRMEIESAPGRGTSIRLTVPQGSPPEIRARAGGGASMPGRVQGSPPEGGSGAIRVLLVDDHRILRQGLAGMLGLEPGIEVVGEAEDGPDAVNQAVRLVPDVVIMDVNLGYMSGVEATRTILSRVPQVRVIGLSMHVGKDAARAMLDAGAVDYLTKGGPLDDLVAAIRSAARRKDDSTTPPKGCTAS